MLNECSKKVVVLSAFCCRNSKFAVENESVFGILSQQRLVARNACVGVRVCVWKKFVKHRKAASSSLKYILKCLAKMCSSTKLAFSLVSFYFFVILFLYRLVFKCFQVYSFNTQMISVAIFIPFCSCVLVSLDGRQFQQRKAQMPKVKHFNKI